jgi:hypothetical protein
MRMHPALAKLGNAVLVTFMSLLVFAYVEEIQQPCEKIPECPTTRAGDRCPDGRACYWVLLNNSTWGRKSLRCSCVDPDDCILVEPGR